MTAKPKGPAPRAATEIEAEIASHEAKKTAAVTELVSLQAQRPALLLDLTDGADDRLDALDKAIAHASRVAPRVDAATAALRSELVALQNAGVEAQRQYRYEKGVAAAAEYRRLALEDYEVAAGAVADILRRMLEQRAIVDRANRALPEAADRPIEIQDTLNLASRVVLPGFAGPPNIWNEVRF